MYEAMATIALGGVLALWLLLSIVAQLTVVPSIQKGLWQQVIPLWTFFAPRPGTKDFHVLFRDYLEDGNVTAWKETLITPGRTWKQTFWNPKNRLEKAVLDVVQAMAFQSTIVSVSELQINMPYLLLLNLVANQKHHQEALATQFLVMMSHGKLSAEEPNVLLLSSRHRL